MIAVVIVAVLTTVAVVAYIRHQRKTRVVDGACIFLNRPGFPGGAGCGAASRGRVR